MKKPLNRGEPVDVNRRKRWVNVFLHYRAPVTEQQINDWLAQFEECDRDMGARVLDSIEFITQLQARRYFNVLLHSLPGWDDDEKKRKGKWRFVAFSMSSGESGDTMVHLFRQANNLNGKQYDKLFIYKRDLVTEALGPDDTVVFIDDFAGTGKQACGTWKASSIPELLAGNSTAYLLLIAGNKYARERIEDETGLEVRTYTELTEADNIFSSKCKYFDSKEKQELIKYCKKANRTEPMGHGKCGFLIVFSHNCPNNSLPILHAYHSKWYGLFRRYD